MRIGSYERQRAYDTLSQHHSAGRIDLAEYDERYQLITTALTQPELDAVFADLPALAGATKNKRTALIALAVTGVVLVAGSIGFAVSRTAKHEPNAAATISTTVATPEKTSVPATTSRSTTPPSGTTTSPPTSTPINSALNTDSYVQDLERLSGGDYHRYDEGTAAVSNLVLTRSVMIAPDGKDIAFTEYDLGRRFLRLDGTLGIRNDATPSGLTMKLRILVDNVPVFEQAIALGDTVPINLGIEQALRLKLEVTNLRPGGDAYAVFGDLRVTTS
ncbi:DUF1707 domain-containing protein [Nocardia sp. NPDC057668]|uniref:DUF1707 domain-containing protein n=1 Tax=Nocardia sp. NPDC057668 TaxID=3346202 RepID=UPI003670EE11